MTEAASSAHETYINQWAGQTWHSHQDSSSCQQKGQGFHPHSAPQFPGTLPIHISHIYLKPGIHNYAGCFSPQKYDRYPPEKYAGLQDGYAVPIPSPYSL